MSLLTELQSPPPDPRPDQIEGPLLGLRWDAEQIHIEQHEREPVTLPWHDVAVQLSRDAVQRPSWIQKMLGRSPKPVHVLVIELRSRQTRVRLTADTTAEHLEGLPVLRGDGTDVPLATARALIDAARFADATLITEGDPDAAPAPRLAGPIGLRYHARSVLLVLTALTAVAGAITAFYAAAHGERAYVSLGRKDGWLFWLFIIAPPTVLVPLMRFTKASKKTRQAGWSIISVVGFFTLVAIGNAAFDGGPGDAKTLYLAGHALLHPGLLFLTFAFGGALSGRIDSDGVHLRGIGWRRQVPWEEKDALLDLRHDAQTLLLLSKRDRDLLLLANRHPDAIPEHLSRARDGSLPTPEPPVSENSLPRRIIAAIIISIAVILGLGYSGLSEENDLRGLILSLGIGFWGVYHEWRRRFMGRLP